MEIYKLKLAKRKFLKFNKKLYQKYIFNNSESEKNVVFLAGVQRSGTNMMMDILDRSLETDVYHETDVRAFNNYNMRSIQTIRDLVENSKGKHIIIKCLLELQKITMIRDQFHNSKIIWVFRNYKDVVNSQVALWNKMPNIVKSIIDDPKHVDWRGENMSEQTYKLISSLYHQDISNESACALFWYFRNILYFEQDLNHKEYSILVNYEKVVNEPNVYIKKNI